MAPDLPFRSAWKADRSGAVKIWRVYEEYMNELRLSRRLVGRRQALQKSLEEGYKADYPTNDGSIHPDYCQALHNLLSTYYEGVLSIRE